MIAVITLIAMIDMIDMLALKVRLLSRLSKRLIEGKETGAWRQTRALEPASNKIRRSLTSNKHCTEYSLIEIDLENLSICLAPNPKHIYTHSSTLFIHMFTLSHWAENSLGRDVKMCAGLRVGWRDLAEVGWGIRDSVKSIA